MEAYTREIDVISITIRVLLTQLLRRIVIRISRVNFDKGVGILDSKVHKLGYNRFACQHVSTMFLSIECEETTSIDRDVMAL